MDYELKAGVLCRQEGGPPLARIKTGLCGPARQILGPDGTLLLRTEIRHLDGPPGQGGDVRYTKYVMCREDGREYASGAPRYAERDDPERVGWPICRMPRTDHALIALGAVQYILRMETSREYSMEDSAGRRVLRIVHRGATGGWRLEAEQTFPACFLCGLFIFCRYLESENQFLSV